METGPLPPAPGSRDTVGSGRAPAAADSAESSGDGLAGAASDFDTFLSLLTTQMRNQDPLKPMESTEFVAQLASFSSVEQQIRSNDRLDAISAALGGETSAAYAGWIGKQVEVPARTAFEGDPVDIAVTPAPGATRARLVVEDAGGAEVARLPVPPDAERLTWAGETSAGPAPAGRYGFRVEYVDAAGPVGQSDGRVFARVSELRLADGSAQFLLEGGGLVDAEEVSAVRDP